ncbi:hypothetical protein LEP1GSC058_0645 [Leptospira fainei serovar Hurstbridge str. BUT 6]|uniref:Uncharacterized protein n=1 Tax=Leptospira fainei serovar Hurstbridge str. BUT 6 TaxID=1193011 RepID=S3VHR5_9LEPT|nr:hypothetical protein [Leptospira fainei]EPG75990.1 hypothetical protein LEP1GSC058_0645 [Leptospira fainei serovar Hurstbridge str. BUT 6]
MRTYSERYPKHGLESPLSFKRSVKGTRWKRKANLLTEIAKLKCGEKFRETRELVLDFRRWLESEAGKKTSYGPLSFRLVEFGIRF